MKKADLPTKICAQCGRPFTWRRKWARDWERVRYCSDACRRGKVPARVGEGRKQGQGSALDPPGGAPLDRHSMGGS